MFCVNCMYISPIIVNYLVYIRYFGEYSILYASAGVYRSNNKLQDKNNIYM